MISEVDTSVMAGRDVFIPIQGLFTCAQVDFNDFGESRLQDDAGQTVDWTIQGVWLEGTAPTLQIELE